MVGRVTDGWARGAGGWLVTANLDFVQRALESPESRGLYGEADLIVGDGAPLVWASRLRGEALPERVAGSDLVWSLARAAARSGRTLFLLGGEGRAAEVAARRFLHEVPGLRVVGHASPWVSSPPSEAEVRALRAEIAEAAPDLVFVALGSPKQEHVIRALRHDFPRAWWMGCGISLSFVAGSVGRAPRWMQRVGLEWVHRLLQEPRRLGRRYLFHNLPFAIRMLARAARGDDVA